MPDCNHWYYPTHGVYSDDDETTCLPGTASSNWGIKDKKGARWMRKGKIAAWGPGIDDWEVRSFVVAFLYCKLMDSGPQAEDHARKRIKMMLPEEERSPSPPILPHLRSPSPPLCAPYPMPEVEQNNWTAFVMDSAVTHTFRSHALQDLEHTTNGMIEGETAFKRAMGRLWRVLGEDPDRAKDAEDIVPKREVEEEGAPGEQARRIAPIPDMTPTIHKIFLTPHANGSTAETAHLPHPEAQLESLERSLSFIRDFQDDRREYAELMEEIREALGNIRAQRDAVWTVVRTNAIRELRTMAAESEL